MPRRMGRGVPTPKTKKDEKPTKVGKEAATKVGIVKKAGAAVAEKKPYPGYNPQKGVGAEYKP